MTIERELTQIERELLKIIDLDKQSLYYCPKHGLYALRKGKSSEKCPRCGTNGELVENAEALKNSLL